MSRVRDLTAITSLDNADLFYVVDDSSGPNGGRKITKANLKTTLFAGASDLPFTPTGTISSTDTQAAIAEVSGDVTSLTTTLDHLVRGWLQYTNSSLQTNSTTTYATLTLDTDQSSFANSLLTKTSSTSFRTDFAGYVRVTYFANGYTDTNDRSVGVRIAKNGTGIAYTVGQLYGKNVQQRSSSASGSTIVSCAVNDVFTFEFASLEATVVSTIPASGVVGIVEAYRRT